MKTSISSSPCAGPNRDTATPSLKKWWPLDLGLLPSQIAPTNDASIPPPTGTMLWVGSDLVNKPHTFCSLAEAEEFLS